VIDKNCPRDTELLRFADADLSPEQLRRLEKHLEVCGTCAKQVMALNELCADVAAEVPAPAWNVAEHVAGVMKRLEEPVTAPRRLFWTLGGGALLAAAATALLFSARSQPPELAARGVAVAPSLSRDVGVQLYAQESALRPLGSGSGIRTDTALTAGLRNLGSQRAHLLLFAIDARHAVHWIAPEFTAPGSDPEATSIAAATGERLLPSAAVFDDLAPGPLRVVAVITATPTHVSEVETLSASQLSDSGLLERFPRAEIRQIPLHVTPSQSP
jgi:hypothetical protein